MRRILAVLLLLVLALLPLAACQAGPVERFPSVTTQLPVPTQAQGTPAAAHPASAPITLRVAAPITAEAAEALRQLYIGFQSGQLARDSQSPIGDRFAPGGALASDRTLSIQFETVPIESVQDGQAWRTLTAGGSLPDVFVSGDLGSLARSGSVAPREPGTDRLLRLHTRRLHAGRLSPRTVNRPDTGRSLSRQGSEPARTGIWQDRIETGRAGASGRGGWHESEPDCRL